MMRLPKNAYDASGEWQYIADITHPRGGMVGRLLQHRRTGRYVHELGGVIRSVDPRDPKVKAVIVQYESEAMA